MISEELTDSLMACNSILTSDCLNLNKPQINILLSCILILNCYYHNKEKEVGLLSR